MTTSANDRTRGGNVRQILSRTIDISAGPWNTRKYARGGEEPLFVTLVVGRSNGGRFT